MIPGKVCFVAMDKENYISLVEWEIENGEIKVDDKIPVLQLARSRNKRQKETEICIKKPSSRIDWKRN